jgi:hypothetical protein
VVQYQKIHLRCHKSCQGSPNHRRTRRPIMKMYNPMVIVVSISPTPPKYEAALRNEAWIELVDPF